MYIDNYIEETYFSKSAHNLQQVKSSVRTEVLNVYCSNKFNIYLNLEKKTNILMLFQQLTRYQMGIKYI